MKSACVGVLSINDFMIFTVLGFSDPVIDIDTCVRDCVCVCAHTHTITSWCWYIVSWLLWSVWILDPPHLTQGSILLSRVN